MTSRQGAVHGVRVLWWLALFELLAGLHVAIGAGPRGQAFWLVTVALGYGVVGATLGAVLARISGRPAIVVAGIAVLVGGLGIAVDRSVLPLALASVAAVLAWVRWRFPGRPSRARTVFRVVFFAGLAAGVALLGARPVGAPEFASGVVPDQPSVLVVVLDTVRRDRLSTYGYTRDTSPHLDALAQRGVTFDGYANACWSLPSHASIVTGRYAGAHGAHYESGSMHSTERTLQQVYGEAGFDTVTITGNPWIHRGNGVGSDFGGFVEAWATWLVPESFLGVRAVVSWLPRDKGGRAGADAFESWLDARPTAERPFFAFVNIFEAHAPYDRVDAQSARRYLPEGVTSAAATQRSEELIAFHLTGRGKAERDALVDGLYDGAIRGADAVLGRYLAALAERGLTDKTVVVVVSDHGEHLGEHELWGHVHGLYEELLQVPFVIAGPGVPRGERRRQVAQLIDVAPTVLALSGGFDLPDVHGQSVLDEPPATLVFAEQFIPVLTAGMTGAERLAGDLGRIDRRRRSVIWPGWKLMVHAGDGVVTDGLYELALGEEQDVQSARPDRVAEGIHHLDSWQQTTRITWPDEVGGGAQVDDWGRDALKALGYAQ
jgi:arylsulfatase A-like enzyme